MRQTRLRVGLLGCGTVGSEVARLLHDDPRLSSTYELAAVAVRDPDKPRRAPLTRGQLCTDALGLARRFDIDIVVEAMGGLDHAGQAVEAALARGAAVVSANKRLFAERGPQLRSLAAANATDVRYEASVAAAIPVVELLRQLTRTDRILRIEGVLNGTCNFVLSEMERTGVGFDEAIQRAQQLGYAEADPTRDLQGSDAADKLAILAQLAWGEDIRTADVQRAGIDGLTADDVANARARGRTWRLVGAATHNGCLVVEPRLLHLDHPFARLNGPQNAITISADYAGPLTLTGDGAGGLATASAMVADLERVAESRTAARHPVKIA